MQDAGGGGGGGSALGAYSWSIATEAAKAELLHDGWTDVGSRRLEKTFEYGAMGHVRTTVSLDVGTGSWEARTTGGDVSEQQVQGYLSAAEAVLEKWPPKIDGLFEKWLDLPQWYEVSADLDWAVKELNIDPDDPNAQGDTLTPANDRLARDVVNLGSRTGELSGTYAETFHEEYINGLPTTIQSLGQVVAALSVAVNAQAELWKRTDDDLSTFGSQALAAMKASGPVGGGDDIMMALTVVGAIATVVAAVPTLGGSTALTAAIVTAGAATAGASSVANTAYSQAKEAKSAKDDIPLGAGHPDDVFVNMETGLTKLSSSIKVQEEGLAGWLDLAHAVATGGGCDLSSPDINTAPGDQVLNVNQDVIVTPGMIAKITELWLPSVAADVRQAGSDLDVTASTGAFHRATDVGLAPNGAWPEFTRLQTKTSQLLTRLSNQLETAAEQLQDAARLIGLNDDAESARLARVERQIESRNVNDADEASRL